ncbi:MAG: AraC family transcriptional regulator [Verrucomicrobiae bacterium]|nr:AraC family transcriptional regulator [Verrucomicrobiae bacterium]
MAICLNLAGHGKICAADGEAVQLEPGTAAFYGRRRGELHAERAGAQRHQFITLELSLAFLRRQKKDNPPWHSAVQRLLAGRTRLTLSDPVAFTPAHRLLIGTLRHPPPVAQVCRLWYQAKALEAASLFLVAPGPAEPCPDEQAASRLQRLNQERALAVAAYLREHLAEPLTLEQIGRAVGVSPCYLSRIFAQAMGCGIFQYLRDLRLDRAAELLRQGRGNVTEAAFSVGYSSLSHFSQAFRERFGCCPGLYPLQTPAQKPRS